MDFKDLIKGGHAIIPYGVTSIGRYAFKNCTELKRIDIPSSVTSIEDSSNSWSRNLATPI